MPSWSRSPEMRAIHLDHEKKVWVRWLFRCCLPAEHIAAVLEVDLAAVDDAIHQKPLRGRPAVTPTGPPRRSSKPVAIFGQNGSHVRVLQSLGYDAPMIASVLDVELRAVRDFLCRLAPIRVPALVRARSRPEQAGIRVRRPRPDGPLTIDPADAWRFADGAAPYDRPETTPAPAAVVEVDLVGAELPPACDAWDGSPSLTPRGKPKLSEEQIVEALELLLSGMSYPAVAKRFKVSVNTLRRYTRAVGTRRTAASFPTEATVYEHGTVRWDMGLAAGRHHTEVRVDCECGHQRWIEAQLVERKDRRFTAQCKKCYQLGRST